MRLFGGNDARQANALRKKVASSFGGTATARLVTMRLLGTCTSRYGTPIGLSPARLLRAGLAAGPAYSPFCLRLRDQMRVKVSPSASSNRLA